MKKLILICSFIFLYSITSYAKVNISITNNSTGKTQQNNSYQKTEIKQKSTNAQQSQAIRPQWIQQNGKWLYWDGVDFAMNGWRQIGDKLYYFDLLGILLQNEYTPDGYYVNANGEKEQKQDYLYAPIEDDNDYIKEYNYSYTEEIIHDRPNNYVSNSYEGYQDYDDWYNNAPIEKKVYVDNDVDLDKIANIKKKSKSELDTIKAQKEQEAKAKRDNQATLNEQNHAKHHEENGIKAQEALQNTVKPVIKRIFSKIPKTKIGYNKDFDTYVIGDRSFDISKTNDSVTIRGYVEGAQYYWFTYDKNSDSIRFKGNAQSVIVNKMTEDMNKLSGRFK